MMHLSGTFGSAGLPGTKIVAAAFNLVEIIPIIVLVILLLFIVAFMYRALNRNLSRLTPPGREMPSVKYEKELAEIQARNQAELEQTRAMLEQAQSMRADLLKDSKEAARAAASEEIARARAEIARERQQNLEQLRRDGTDAVNRIDNPSEPPRN